MWQVIDKKVKVWENLKEGWPLRERRRKSENRLEHHLPVPPDRITETISAPSPVSFPKKKLTWEELPSRQPCDQLDLNQDHRVPSETGRYNDQKTLFWEASTSEGGVVDSDDNIMEERGDSQKEDSCLAGEDCHALSCGSETRDRDISLMPLEKMFQKLFASEGSGNEPHLYHCKSCQNCKVCRNTQIKSEADLFMEQMIYNSITWDDKLGCYSIDFLIEDEKLKKLVNNQQAAHRRSVNLHIRFKKETAI